MHSPVALLLRRIEYLCHVIFVYEVAVYPQRILFDAFDFVSHFLIEAYGAFVMTHHGQFQPMKFMVNRPCFECLEQLFPNSLACKALPDPDHDICTMAISAKVSPSSRPAPTS
jgi:hypothetical protein